MRRQRTEGTVSRNALGWFQDLHMRSEQVDDDRGETKSQPRVTERDASINIILTH